MREPRRVGVLVNPASGAGRGEKFAKRLSDLWPSREWSRWRLDGTLDLDGLGSFVENLDLLTIVGGDGTVGKVASSLKAAVEAPPPLVIVPAGRGNSAYRHYYGERPWPEVIRGFSRGIRTGPLDLGRVEADVEPPAESFVLGWSVGLFPHSLRVADRLTWLPGRLAYRLSSAWTCVARPPVTLRVEDTDGVLFEGEALLAAAAGGRFRGGDHELFPGSRPGRDPLDLLVVEPPSVGELPALFSAFRSGNHLSQDGVHRWRAPRFRLRAPSPLSAEMDGTLFEDPVRKITLRARPSALKVAYPRGGDAGG